MLLIFGSLKHPSTSFLFEFLWSTWCKYFQSFYESLSSHCPSSLPQCFLPQSKVFPRCLSCAAAFHMSEEETWSYVSPFIPWLRHHRSGLLMSFVTEVMQMSSHVVLKASLSLALSLFVATGMRRGTIWRGNEASKRWFHTVCNFLVFDIVNIEALACISRGWALVSSECIELTIPTANGCKRGPYESNLRPV